jgi:hypothetical protein
MVTPSDTISGALRVRDRGRFPATSNLRFADRRYLAPVVDCPGPNGNGDGCTSQPRDPGRREPPGECRRNNRKFSAT